MDKILKVWIQKASFYFIVDKTEYQWKENIWICDYNEKSALKLLNKYLINKKEKTYNKSFQTTLEKNIELTNKKTPTLTRSVFGETINISKSLEIEDLKKNMSINIE